MSAEPKNLAQAVKATRDEFEAAFIAAQNEFNRGAVIKSFKMIARNMGSDVEAFEAAFSVARQQGWLLHLVRACEVNGLGTIALFRASDELQATNQSPASVAGDLQRLYGQNLIKVFILERRLPLLRAATCLINVGNGESSGTGFLVGPDLIITAWHVVRSLFVDQSGGPAQPVENGSTQIEVTFDESPIQERVAVKVAKDWHVASSSCHSDELNGLLPANLDLLKNHFDFAIIRLDDDPGRRRGWLRIERDLEPRKHDKICIFQHPLQNSLSFDFGEFAGFVDPSRTRFFHRVGAAFGSSGGPCVNNRFQLVGLHQAGFMADVGDSGARRNRAIVAARLWQAVSNCPAPRPLWRLPNSAPVLARSNLQQASNICTNQALNALAVTVYLTLAGPEGLKQVASVSAERAHHLAKAIAQVPGFSLVHDGPFINEFAVKSPIPVDELLERLEERGILGGVALGRWFPELQDCFLVAVTELNTPEALEALVAGLRDASRAKAGV